MRFGRLALAAFVFAVATGAASAARAQASDPAAADALFRKGREAAEKGDWATACPKFAESQRLDPAPGTLLNLADCEEHLGKVASAYEHFKTALETMAANDDRVPFAKQHMAAVEKKVPHLTLAAGAELPASARVTKDEVQLGSASFGLALPVDPGTHAIVVAAPGRVDRRVTVTLKPGEAQTITLRAGDAEPSAPPPGSLSTPTPTPTVIAARGTPDEPPPHATGSARTAGVVVAAVGGAGIVLGAVAGLVVLGKKSTVDDPSNCDPQTHACNQAGVDAANAGKTFSTVSTVGFVGGAALAAVGAVLIVVGGGHGARAGTALAPDFYAGGGGVRVIQTF